MNKKYFIGGIIVLLVVIGVITYSFQKETSLTVSGKDAKNTTYIVEGQPVTLIDGVSEISTPGSASKTITRYFGNEVVHDLNDDGRDDIAFLITQQTGGSGTFFYAVAALNTPTGYRGSDTFFLGDRIAPQSTRINEEQTSQGTYRKNVIEINYATRLPNEPMTAVPSVGKSVWIKLDPATMQLGEVVQDFEGESR